MLKNYGIWTVTKRNRSYYDSLNLDTSLLKILIDSLLLLHIIRFVNMPFPNQENCHRELYFNMDQSKASFHSEIIWLSFSPTIMEIR